MATLKDVANEVGVSVATVSYVLTGRGSVGEAMTKKVLAAVEKLEYRPNRKAQAMRTGVSKSIGLVIPDLTNPFYPALAQSIENAARTAGFSVILIDCQNKTDIEEEGLNLLEQHIVDGIIWCPTGDKSIKKLSESKCPVVLLDRSHPGFNAVHCDYLRGGELLAEYAIKLGHRKIGLLSGPQRTDSAVQRRLGFINAAADNLDVMWEVEVPFSSELNAKARKALNSNSVSLVVAANDLIAVGAIGALKDAGLRVPQDVSIVGFDNIPWSAVITPRLTTINQPVSFIAAEAVDMLVQKILSPEKPVRTIVLDVELVERDSALPCLY